MAASCVPTRCFISMTVKWCHHSDGSICSLLSTHLRPASSFNPEKAELGRGCKTSWISGALLPWGWCFGSKAVASSTQAIWSQLRCIHIIRQIKLSEGLGETQQLEGFKKEKMNSLKDERDWKPRKHRKENGHSPMWCSSLGSEINSTKRANIATSWFFKNCVLKLLGQIRGKLLSTGSARSLWSKKLVLGRNYC